MTTRFQSLLEDLHPMPRNGVAVATLEFNERTQQGKLPSELTEDQMRIALADAIERGLENFRMETHNDPAIEDTLKFQPIPRSKLLSDSTLVQSSGLSAKGKYLFPSVVTSDGSAKNTFVETDKLMLVLRAGGDLLKPVEMKRSFAPTMGEVNNGRPEKQNLKGSLLEAAASAVATLTPDKASSLSGGSNTAIFPDLPVNDLYEFARVLKAFQGNGFSSSPYEKNLPRPNASENTKPQKPVKLPKAGKVAAPKSEYRRPPLHDGNYPDAPREAAFGAVGLLAALGYWANEAEFETDAETLQMREETRRVVEGLAGVPLYLIRYDGVAQAQFSHHVVRLAASGKLKTLLHELWRDTKPYALYDQPYIKHDLPVCSLLYRAMSHFLQRFDAASFRDFMATRAEYPQSARLLFEEYFMRSAINGDQGVPRPIVESARALGQHLNLAAYLSADADVESSTTDRRAKVQKQKAKILVEFESAVMSAKAPADMLQRVSVRAGRLLQSDAPAEATAYYEATAAGEISFEVAQQLLVAFMRLRPARAADANGKISTLISESPSEIPDPDTF